MLDLEQSYKMTKHGAGSVSFCIDCSQDWLFFPSEEFELLARLKLMSVWQNLYMFFGGLSIILCYNFMYFA